MKQILLHPGFHKTGTSSIQHFLWQNRPALSPHLSMLMLRHLKDAVRACGRFARTQNPMELVDLVGLMDDAFNENPSTPAQDVLISCEGLSGLIPGHPEVNSYDAVPTLASYVAGYLAERFPRAQVKVIYTTRAPDDWLFSAYRHHLRHNRITADWATFSTTYAGAADLNRVVAAVAEALDPLPVMYLPLEVARAHPLGPGGALVDQTNVPADVREMLTPVGHGNAGPDDALSAQFLALNRSDLPNEDVVAQKTALADAARLGG